MDPNVGTVSVFSNLTSIAVDLTIEGTFTLNGPGTGSWYQYAGFIYETKAPAIFLDLKNSLTCKTMGTHFFYPNYAYLGGFMKFDTYVNNFTMNGTSIHTINTNNNS